MSESDALEPRPGGDRKKLYIWLGILGVFLVIVAAGVYITEQSWFCGEVCHEMGPSYESWAASPHPNIRCVECHVEPGIAGWFEGHVQDGLRDVWLHFTERPDRVTMAPEPIPPEQCLGECHGDQFDAAENAEETGEDDEAENALPGNHPPRDSDCVECHYDEIHEGE